MKKKQHSAPAPAIKLSLLAEFCKTLRSWEMKKTTMKRPGNFQKEFLILPELAHKRKAPNKEIHKHKINKYNFTQINKKIDKRNLGVEAPAGGAFSPLSPVGPQWARGWWGQHVPRGRPASACSAGCVSGGTDSPSHSIRTVGAVGAAAPTLARTERRNTGARSLAARCSARTLSHFRRPRPHARSQSGARRGRRCSLRHLVNPVATPRPSDTGCAPCYGFNLNLISTLVLFYPVSCWKQLFISYLLFNNIYFNPVVNNTFTRKLFKCLKSINSISI